MSNLERVASGAHVSGWWVSRR